MACTALINGRYSLTGVHNWFLTGRPGKSADEQKGRRGKAKKVEREVRCHFCNAEPPRGQRAPLIETMLAAEKERLEQTRRMATLRKVMKGPA